MKISNLSVFVVLFSCISCVLCDDFQCVRCEFCRDDDDSVKESCPVRRCYVQAAVNGYVNKGCWNPFLLVSADIIAECNTTLCNSSPSLRYRRYTRGNHTNDNPRLPNNHMRTTLPPVPPKSDDANMAEPEKETVLKCYLCSGMACDRGDYMLQTCEYGVTQCVSMKYRDIDGEDMHEKRCNNFRLPWLISFVHKGNCGWVKTKRGGHCNVCSDDFCNSRGKIGPGFALIVVLFLYFIQ